MISVVSTTATSITLSGGVPSDSVADSYEVMWERDTLIGCSDVDMGMATNDIIKKIKDLHEDSVYYITVTASNSAGSSEVSTFTAITKEAGEIYQLLMVMSLKSTIIPPVSSEPPTSVRVSGVTSSSITVQWGPVDCIYRNGDITGYSVQYIKLGGSGTESSLQEVTNRQATISGLTPSTVYAVFVAAVNSAGTGVYSDEVVQETEGEHITDALNIMCLINGIINKWYILLW